MCSGWGWWGGWCRGGLRGWWGGWCRGGLRGWRVGWDGGWRALGGGWWRGELGAFDPESGQVEAVAVGELAQAVEVEVAQEGPLAAGEGQVAGVDDRGRGGLVVGDAGQQEDQAGGGRGGRVGPVGAGAEGDLLGEPPSVHAVVAGQLAGGRVDLVGLVAEFVAPRRSRIGRRGHGLNAHRDSFWCSRAMAANRPQGCSARWLKNGVDGGPVGTSVR